MNAVEEVNRRFNEELERQVNGTLPLGHVYQLGLPGEILLSAGFPATPIEMAATRLAEKAKQENHPFAIMEVGNLVTHINDPVAVFRYGRNAKNVIVGIEHNGKQFLIGIHFNRNGNGLEVSSVRGIFPKDNFEWLHWISQGKADYLNKEKVQILIDKQQINPADVTYLDLDFVAKIVQNFQNPTLKNQNTMEKVKQEIKHEVEEARYNNGQLAWRQEYKNGLMDGLYEAWHENGQLSERMLYKEGEREGLRETWHENGSLSCRMTFKDGKIEGLREDWHENGRPLFRVNYKGDLLDGLSESWHDNGKLASREYYKNNRKHGLCEEWGRNGRLIEKSVYENGIKVSQIKKQTVSPKKRGLGL